jgi:hypothetical protein
MCWNTKVSPPSPDLLIDDIPALIKCLHLWFLDLQIQRSSIVDTLLCFLLPASDRMITNWWRLR